VWLCEWGRRTYGLDIRPGTIFAQSYPDRAFDTVTVWDVLEHVPDPLAFLKECRRVLKPGGLLVVNYPDIGSWAARWMGRDWVMLVSVHLYFFTRQTLADAANRAGFEIVEMRPHIQWLEWGYLLKRAEPVAGRLARGLSWLSARAGLSRVQVPYWIGQTLVVARARAD
jgi:SAM-dependent methyltransferase